MRFTMLVMASWALATTALPAHAAILDDFNRANTASGANGLGADWTMLKSGASISNNMATGGTQALYQYVGSGGYSPNQAEFDFATASSPTVGTYYDGALLNWDGTSGYFLKVQHQGTAAGYTNYSLGYVTYNSGNGLFTYTNGIFGSIGATLTSGHLAASVIGNVGALTLTSGSSTYAYNFTYAAAQTFTGTGIGLGIQDGARLDNFASAAVPEPATWAMMLIGFGAIGATLRRRRSAQRALLV